MDSQSNRLTQKQIDNLKLENKEGEGNGKQKRKPELHLPAWQNEWKTETCRRLGRGT